jgi:hypothetical protein
MPPHLLVELDAAGGEGVGPLCRVAEQHRQQGRPTEEPTRRILDRLQGSVETGRKEAALRNSAGMLSP